MNKNSFKQFLQVQSEEINKHKWIESERKGYDLGQEAIINWIKLYADSFRRQYESNHPDIV